ncbi:MAG: hypothetical protein JHC84_08010 [Solirubrobacteraceae bacterium]|nr:hypothetical protein [Solirubrobacteraceae bacterium]
MNPMKHKGDLAELKVASDIRQRGHQIALPYGEDWLFDLIVLRFGRLERVQVKHGVSDGRVLEVRAHSLTITAGRVKAVHRYTEADIDWLAVWDSTTDQCAYIPAVELGTGRRSVSLRLDMPRNNQRRGIRMMENYLEF